MTFTMWMLRAANGEFWRYTNGKPIVYDTRSAAKCRAASLDPYRKWKVVRCVLTVSGSDK